MCKLRNITEKILNNFFLEFDFHLSIYTWHIPCCGIVWDHMWWLCFRLLRQIVNWGERLFNQLKLTVYKKHSSQIVALEKLSSSPINSVEGNYEKKWREHNNKMQSSHGNLSFALHSRAKRAKKMFTKRTTSKYVIGFSW